MLVLGKYFFSVSHTFKYHYCGVAILGAAFLGYSYETLVREFLGHVREVFREFSRFAAKHYGRENIDAMGLPGFLDRLYEFVENLYLSGRKHSRAAQAIYIWRGKSPCT